MTDEVAAARRYRWLGRWLLTGDAAGVAQLLTQKAELDRRGGPFPKRLARLEELLEERGVLDRAVAFADQVAAPEAVTGGRR